MLIFAGAPPTGAMVRLPPQRCSARSGRGDVPPPQIHGLQGSQVAIECPNDEGGCQVFCCARVAAEEPVGKEQAGRVEGLGCGRGPAC